MNNPHPNPDIVFSRDGTSHRCAELFDSRSSATACANCRTLVHYLLGHRVDFEIAADTARAAEAVRDGERDAVYDALKPITPCLRPATAMPPGIPS